MKCIRIKKIKNSIETQEMAKKLLTRRRLLTASGAAASLNIIKPGILFGAEKSSLSKLSVGFIGMGGQIQSHVNNLSLIHI